MWMGSGSVLAKALLTLLIMVMDSLVLCCAEQIVVQPNLNLRVLHQQPNSIKSC